MYDTEPTLDASDDLFNRDPSLSQIHEHVINARAELFKVRDELSSTRRAVRLSTVLAASAASAALIVAIFSVWMVRAEVAKMREAVTSLHTVEKTLQGMTEAQAEETIRLKMLREIKARASKAGRASDSAAVGDD